MENRVRFKIGEIEFEAEGTADVVERERDVFLNKLLPAAVEAIVRTKVHYSQPQYVTKQDKPLLEQIDKTETNNNIDSYTIVETSSQDFSRTSISEYIKNFGDVPDQDFVIIAVYFFEKKSGKTISFTSETIKQYYADARRKPYSNYSGLLAKLANKALIMDDPNAEKKTPKAYILTSSGISYAEDYQPKENIKKAKTTKSTKTKAKIPSQYSKINVDELNLSKYPDISRFKSFKEQMIMIMYIVTTEGKGEWFSVSDVQCLLTDILGLPASINQINGIFKDNKRWFQSEQDPNNKKAKHKKLLNGGKEFAIELLKQHQLND